MEEEEYEAVSYPWNWKPVLVIVGDFLADVLESGSSAIRALAVRTAASYNHDCNQRDFRNAILRDIETITEED